MAKGVLIISATMVLLGSSVTACDLDGEFGRFSPFYAMRHNTAQKQVVIDPSVTEVFAKTVQPETSPEVLPSIEVTESKAADTHAPKPEKVAGPKNKTAGKPVKSL